MIQPTTIEKAVKSPHYSPEWMSKWISICHRSRAGEGLWLTLMNTTEWTGTIKQLTRSCLRFTLEDSDQRATARALRHARENGMIDMETISGRGNGRDPVVFKLVMR